MTVNIPRRKDSLKKGFTAHVLLKGFQSSENELSAGPVAIQLVTNRNLGHWREVFSEHKVFSGTHSVFSKHWKTRPEFPDGTHDYSEGGAAAAFELTDDLLIFRLFKTGDILFQAITFEAHDLSFSIHGSGLGLFAEDFPPVNRYKLSASELEEFNIFYSKMKAATGFKAPWFRTAAQFFLQGSSRALLVKFEAMRVLDYIVALEASIVSEKDFVSRRLRERTEKYNPGSIDIIKQFYDIRSSIAHGSELTNDDRTFIEENISKLEVIIRQTLMSLRNQ